MQSGAGELYVRLLCEFEPAAVLPFLQAHDAYRVEKVLPYTQQYGVDDAQVILFSVSCLISAGTFEHSRAFLISGPHYGNMNIFCMKVLVSFF